MREPISILLDKREALEDTLKRPETRSFAMAPETPAARVGAVEPTFLRDPLLTVEDVAALLNVTKDWVWDHSSRKAPYLPVIRMGDGTLRYRSSGIEEFVNERERLFILRRKRR